MQVRCIVSGAPPEKSRRHALESAFQSEAIFLDARVGQDLFGTSLDLSLRFITADTVIECYLKILALAKVANAAIPHLLQRAVNCLSLRVEHTLLQRDVNVGSHRRIPLYPPPSMRSLNGATRH